MIIIDAKNAIAGRIGTFAAKQALLGETIHVVNSESAYVTGEKRAIAKRFKWKHDELGTYKGPILPKRPERILKRMIRGMLPYKKPRGREALKRIKCHIGIPEELKDKEAIVLENAKVSKVPNLKYVKIRDISKLLGAKI